MQTLFAIVALLVVIIGSGLVTKIPGTAAPKMAAVEATELQPDQMPVYIHFDTDDWR